MGFVTRFTFGLLLLGCCLLAACGREADGAAGEAGGRAIQNKGSDTLVNIALAWAEQYRVVRPDVSIAVTGGGSGTGIAALMNGTVDIANSSREIKEEEFAAAQAGGVQPHEFVVAIDALAIIVHPDNPVEQLTIAQLAAIYTGRVTNWSQVGGVDGDIVLLSRESNSGTHVYFLEEVVRGGEEGGDIFAPQTLFMPSSVGITSEVRRNRRAIGYDGLGYVDEAHEKVLAIARDDNSPYFKPAMETAASGDYPIARDLYMVTAGEPSGAIAEYLAWILSPEGQQIVAELGFIPVTAER